MRYGAAENEAASLDACHSIDPGIGPGLDQLVDDSTEGVSVPQQCRDVAELDTGLGIVRNRPDGGADGVACAGVHAH